MAKATAKKKKSARKAAAKPAKKTGKKTARKLNAAFLRPLELSAALASVLGKKTLPRPAATKKLLDYIKKNNLQDLRRRTIVNADEKLREVFGKAKVTILEIPKILGRHLK